VVFRQPRYYRKQLLRSAPWLILLAIAVARALGDSTQFEQLVSFLTSRPSVAEIVFKSTRPSAAAAEVRRGLEDKFPGATVRVDNNVTYRGVWDSKGFLIERLRTDPRVGFRVGRIASTNWDASTPTLQVWVPSATSATNAIGTQAKAGLAILDSALNVGILSVDHTTFSFDRNTFEAKTYTGQKLGGKFLLDKRGLPQTLEYTNFATGLKETCQYNYQQTSDVPAFIPTEIVRYRGQAFVARIEVLKLALTDNPIPIDRLAPWEVLQFSANKWNFNFVVHTNGKPFLKTTDAAIPVATIATRYPVRYIRFLYFAGALVVSAAPVAIYWWVGKSNSQRKDNK
jgi:hypothetical protein